MAEEALRFRWSLFAGHPWRAGTGYRLGDDIFARDGWVGLNKLLSVSHINTWESSV